MDQTKTRAGHTDVARRRRFRPLRRLSDDELAAAVAAGDRRAFGAIFERYHQPLFRYCASIVGDRDQAADALQNTMIAALRGLEGEERAIALRPWLYRIAHNQSISLIRRRRPEEPLDVETLDRLGAATAGATAADAATRERLQEMLGDLRELPEQQRSALLLRELTGLEYDEVGTALAITPNGARQAVFKARRALQLSVVGRSAECDSVQSSMSNHDGRFQRRREIRAHLDDCANCTAFATALAQRPRDLEALFPVLPAASAAGILAETTGPTGEDDKRRRGFPLFLLLAGIAVAATAAVAALSGGGGDEATRPSAASIKPSVTPSASAPAPKPRAEHPAKKPKPKPKPKPRKHSHPSATPSATLSSVSGYSTAGARTEVALGDACGDASDGSNGGDANGSDGSSSGSCTSAAEGSGSSAGGLPYTGLEIGLLVTVALMLLCCGLALRRLESVRTRR